MEWQCFTWIIGYRIRFSLTVLFPYGFVLNSKRYLTILLTRAIYVLYSKRYLTLFPYGFVLSIFGIRWTLLIILQTDKLILVPTYVELGSSLSSLLHIEFLR